ncbi:hypothetical protein FACS1894123_10710 [Bacteroidia bacterium]|jgi:hypothetical protein|nr:hypothetical protein FACS1894123_10710 [Bacteroidia bacterium]
MRFIALSVLALVGVSAQAAPQQLAPEAFVGNYKLVEARYGLLCEDPMQGLLSKSLEKSDDKYVQIDLGPFYFPAVNAGPQKFEDDLSTSMSESGTTATSLVFQSREVSKIDGEVSTQVIVAEFQGDKLHITSTSKFAHQGGTKGETRHECVYQKVPAQK